MTDSADRAPYARLTPHQMLDALAASGFAITGGLIQLNSYENRVVQAALEGGEAVVAKFYRPKRWNDAQILEEHTFARELEAEDLPVAAPLVLGSPFANAALGLVGDPPTLGHWQPEVDPDDDDRTPSPVYRFGVAPRRAGRAPELENLHTLSGSAACSGECTRWGARRPFEHRRALDCDSRRHAGARPRRPQRPVDRRAIGHVAHGRERPWRSTSRGAPGPSKRAGPLRPIRLHGDCHPGNILWREEGDFAGPLFVDLDDACMGPAVQDLWMLLSGDRDAMQGQLSHVLNGYRAFMDFNTAELGLIEPLRALRMIHHSAWIAARWDDPAFPAAFPWFGTPAYWDQQITTQLREQLEHMALPALQCA